MRFIWDEQKRRSNLAKHGLDFANAQEVLTGEIVTIEDTRFRYDERRYLSIGILQQRVVVVAHTEQDDLIRIISMRKASKNEQKAYYQSL